MFLCYTCYIESQRKLIANLEATVTALTGEIAELRKAVSEQLTISELNNPFGHKLLQIYNDFVRTVSRLNRDMNNSLAAVRLPIRKPGPHNSRGPVGTLK